VHGVDPICQLSALRTRHATPQQIKPMVGVGMEAYAIWLDERTSASTDRLLKADWLYSRTKERLKNQSYFHSISYITW